MKRSLAVVALAGGVAVGVIVGTAVTAGSSQSPPSAGGAYAEQQRAVPLRVQAARAQRSAIVAVRRANAATTANRSLSQRLAQAEARVAALEASAGQPAPAPPPDPPAPPPAEEPAASGETMSGTWSTYEIVRSDSATAAPGSLATAFVNCPAGFRALGGGLWTGTLHFLTPLTNNVQQIASWPTVTPEGTGRWNVRVLNPATANRSYRVYAACAKVGP